MDVESFGPKGYRVSVYIRTRLPDVATILLLPEGHDHAGAGAEAFVTPPFTSRRLLYRVKKVAHGLASGEIRAGKLVLDPHSRILRRVKTIARLRPKEAATLALFMRNRGKVLSRREIMKQVWETDYLVSTISIHVRWLRLKIEDEPSAPRHLRTVRGVGYRFDVAEANMSDVRST